MNKYRSAALALAACMAAVPVAACSAGVTTTSSAATTPSASSHGTSAGASSPSPALSASTFPIGGSLGSFPIPAGAKVAGSTVSDQEVVVFFTLITPAKVSSFYATTLPRAGYVVTGNSVLGQSGGTEVAILFSGHGYKGDIVALSNFSTPGLNVAGIGHKNVTEIMLTRK